jgi:hypothetical protein
MHIGESALHKKEHIVCHIGYSVARVRQVTIGVGVAEGAHDHFLIAPYHPHGGKVGVPLRIQRGKNGLDDHAGSPLFQQVSCSANSQPMRFIAHCS